MSNKKVQKTSNLTKKNFREIKRFLNTSKIKTIILIIFKTLIQKEMILSLFFQSIQLNTK
jgi:hypothetical protein